jgi:tropomyosin
MYSSFREADLRAEQLGKKIIKLEQELGIWDKKNADLQEKYDKAKGEMDELEGNLEDI